jgi:hypothetical protein
MTPIIHLLPVHPINDCIEVICMKKEWCK